jgi:hypothetical protein
VDDGAGSAITATFDITIRPNPGDYDQDLLVEAADYVLWRKTLGNAGVPAYSGADGDGDTIVDEDDYEVWRAHFGMTVPTPAAGGHAVVPTSIASATLIHDAAVLLPEAPADFTLFSNPPRIHGSIQSRLWFRRYGFDESANDDLLLLAIDRIGRRSEFQSVAIADDFQREDIYLGNWKRLALVEEPSTVAHTDRRSEVEVRITCGIGHS